MAAVPGSSAAFWAAWYPVLFLAWVVRRQWRDAAWLLVSALLGIAVVALPLLVYFLTHMGLVSPDFLRRYRRHALVALAILSAVITPPDVFSMILVLLPLFGLYEYSIRISERTLRRSSGTEGTTTEGK